MRPLIYTIAPLKHHLINIGSGTSDPHFATLNGKRYDFQGEGEFVTLELLPNNPPQFMLQGRQKVFPFEGWLPASWHVAVAFGRLDLAFQVSIIILITNN